MARAIRRMQSNDWIIDRAKLKCKSALPAGRSESKVILRRRRCSESDAAEPAWKAGIRGLIPKPKGASLPMNRQCLHTPRVAAALFFSGRAFLLVALALSSAAIVNAQATFSGTQIALVAGTLAAPTGVASDGSGNIFIADRGNNRVVELSPSSSGFDAPTTVISGLSGPAGVAADWNGNVFVADTGNGRILMLPFTKSGFGSPVTVATGLSTPSGVAVDSADNIYVAVSGSNCVMEIPSTAGGYGAPFVVASGFNNPLGVAVDAARTLYVADTGNKRVAKQLYSVGGYATPTYMGGTGVTPVSVYVDKSYDLFFTDSESERLVESPWRPPPIAITGSSFSAAALLRRLAWLRIPAEIFMFQTRQMIR